MDMSCFLLPAQPPMLKLAFLPRLVIGYTPTYPATNTQPTGTTTQPRIFPRQPTLSLPTIANGSFRPALTGGATNTVLPTPFTPGLHITPSYPTKPHFRAGFNKAGSPGKGVKRKLEDNGSTNGDINGKVDSSLYPLYCKVCRVTLNAPAQAKQHYEGKNHAKKLKMSADGKDEENGSSKSDQPSSTTNGTTPTAEIKAEVYCKICGVSFNSPKQAQQHYQGKNHAKKVRATSHANNNHSLCRHHDSSHKSNCKYSCRTCHSKSSNPLDSLESHLAGVRHNSRNNKISSERNSSILRGRWAQKGGVGHNGISNSGDLNGGICSSGGVNGIIGITAHHGGATSSSPSPPTGGVAVLSAVSNNNPLFSTQQHSSCLNNNNNIINNNNNKRCKRDFSMYRTPSGKYYCSTCNVTLNSEPQFAQHMESKKHKASQSSSRRNSDPLLVPSNSIPDTS